MERDELQQAWQAHSRETRVTIDAALLRQVVQSEQQQFRAMIYWRDFREVTVALLMIPMWFILGAVTSSPWTWYLTVPVLVWIAGFMLVYRKRYTPRPSEPGEPLVSSVKTSLAEAEAQIWLLRNIFWWYLLPPTISLMAFFVQVSWRTSSAWWEFAIMWLFSGLFLLVLYGWVYRLNQRAVRVQLEPRRQELLGLLASLQDDTVAKDADSPVALPALPFAGKNLETQNFSLNRFIIGMALAVVIMLAAFAIMAVIGGNADSLPGGGVDAPREPEFDDMSEFGEQDITRIDAWLEEQIEIAKYPSLSAAIVRDGEIVYANAFGFADVKAQSKATPQTPYHVASVTKAFTATLAVLLAERGVVDLDQPAAKYLPADVAISTDPEIGATITLRQLASHTSGLPRGVPGQVQTVEGHYQLEPQRLYDHLAKVELQYDPGGEEVYSNLGFGLLAHALERAADKPFEALVQEMICAPLELKNTAIQADDKFRPATGYDDSGWRFERSHSFRERLAGSGGLVASVEDLAKFLTAQMAPGVFSEEALQQLHTESTLADGSPAGTALGWSVTSRRNIGPIVHKNGGRSNCSAWIGFAPQHKVGVAVVTNCGGPDVDPIGFWLLHRAISQKLVADEGYAKAAPFLGVRWEDDRPIVLLPGGWSRLVSIDGVAVDEIMEFANQQYGDLAHKRFAEDLVELLSRMGQPPNRTVDLEVQLPDSPETQVLKDVLMSEANRRLIKSMADLRERLEE